VVLAKGMVALVAEDHNFQRRTLVRMLKTLGAKEVLEAKDGLEALTILKDRGAIDLLICDLDMGQMDGMELIRNIGKSDSVGSIIILSGHERSLLDAVAKMADAYGVKLLGAIDKPLTLDRLQNLLASSGPAIPAPEPGRRFSVDEILNGIQLGQFESFFQPKVSMSSGLIVGAEALARWHHPEHGLIGPNAFIPPLEQAGDVGELTFLMLKQAALACRNWDQHRSGISVSVNISFTSLGDPALAEEIGAITSSVDLSPNQMTLEITETAAIGNVGATLENLVRLRMRGFGLSIDDYGTGFASLQQLQLAPFTELKIDKSFVTDCAENPSSRAIVESSVQMARQLGFRSVAEGVETQADWNILRDAGCDMAQGYFIARPMTEVQFLTFLTRETG
jgi:EAL domain-containing protein (putative c-di-GMP-specific phosphodiesterase class I)/ActR/RegA family two-component response regulator